MSEEAIIAIAPWSLRAEARAKELLNQRQLAVHQRALLESTNEQIIAQKQTEETPLAATRAKSEFLANMSHEIRTPMTAILGYTEILAESIERPEQQEAIQTIKRNGKHLLDLINDILDLSKIESGKLQIEQLPTSPMAILGDVVSLMRVRADAKGLTLKLVYCNPLPQSIQTDPTRLRQILVNLVGNAIKFTETGDVKIAVRLADHDTANPKLRCDVIDITGKNHYVEFPRTATPICIPFGTRLRHAV